MSYDTNVPHQPKHTQNTHTEGYYDTVYRCRKGYHRTGVHRQRKALCESGTTSRWNGVHAVLRAGSYADPRAVGGGNGAPLAVKHSHTPPAVSPPCLSRVSSHLVQGGATYSLRNIDTLRDKTTKLPFECPVYSTYRACPAALGTQSSSGPARRLSDRSWLTNGASEYAGVCPRRR